MSTTQKGGTRVGPDATQIMLQKNDRIREKYVKRMKTLGKEEERCTEDRTRQIYDLRKEIKDLHAYTAVYRDNSLVMIDTRRKPISYDEIMMASKEQNPKTNLQPPTPSLARSTPTPNKKRSKTAKTAIRRDPFHLKNCLQDVELERKSHDSNKQVSLPPTAGDSTKISTRKRLKRSSTAIPKSSHSQYQSLLPGNCTSYYSIRKYYEQEKDKLLVKWSPQERRKKTVRWILDNITIPQFGVMRQTTTSAIFREFKHYRESPNKARQTDAKHVTLPSIKQPNTNTESDHDSESATDEEEKEDNSDYESDDETQPITVEGQLRKVSLRPTTSNPV